MSEPMQPEGPGGEATPYVISHSDETDPEGRSDETTPHVISHSDETDPEGRSGETTPHVISYSNETDPEGPSDETTPHMISHNDETDPYDDNGDNDSALGSEPDSDTETLNSFITRYTWQNGRRYHADHVFNGSYWGPNDESANDQQDLAHHLYKLTLDGKLHLAPIENPHNVLDLGTGTGIWAIEMADLYPSAHVVGTDISPIQPHFVPPNCNFEIEDVTMEWTFPYNHFDFIHIRELFGSVPDWDYFFHQTYLACKPGGWVEVLEHSVEPVADDDTCGPDAFFTLWGKTVIEMGEKSGNSFSIWAESKERLERAGFIDVVETRYKWPMNGWSRDPKLRELGLWNQLRLYDGVEGYMLRLLTKTGGWSYERAQLHLAQMRLALKDMNVHAYLDVSVVYGRKPDEKFRI